MTDSNIPIDLKEFINRVVPTRYRSDPTYIHEKGRILTNIEHVTPEQILVSDPYFEEFRINEEIKQQSYLESVYNWISSLFV